QDNALSLSWCACDFASRSNFARCHDALPGFFILRSLPWRKSLRHSLRTFRRRDRVESRTSHPGDPVMDATLRRATGASCTPGALQLVQLLFILGLANVTSAWLNEARKSNARTHRTPKALRAKFPERCFRFAKLWECARVLASLLQSQPSK